LVFAEFEVPLDSANARSEGVRRQSVVSKLSVCAPKTSEPLIRDMHGRIESVQGLVHFVTSTLYFRTFLRVAMVLGRVVSGPCPLEKVVNVVLTSPR
jgi:hypothetical protein